MNGYLQWYHHRITRWDIELHLKIQKKSTRSGWIFWLMGSDYDCLTGSQGLLVLTLVNNRTYILERLYEIAEPSRCCAFTNSPNFSGSKFSSRKRDKVGPGLTLTLTIKRSWSTSVSIWIVSSVSCSAFWGLILWKNFSICSRAWLTLPASISLLVLLMMSNRV